jgi:hypothetical protein
MNSSHNLESSVMITECYFPKATARDDLGGRANNANSLATARDYPEGRANNANSFATAMDDQDAEQITLIR